MLSAKFDPSLPACHLRTAIHNLIPPNLSNFIPDHSPKMNFHLGFSQLCYTDFHFITVQLLISLLHLSRLNSFIQQCHYVQIIKSQPPEDFKFFIDNNEIKEENKSKQILTNEECLTPKIRDYFRSQNYLGFTTYFKCNSCCLDNKIVYWYFNVIWKKNKHMIVNIQNKTLKWTIMISNLNYKLYWQTMAKKILQVFVCLVIRFPWVEKFVLYEVLDK